MTRRLSALLVAALPGCWLEQVSGEPVPLDPAFYESVEASQGQPGIGGGSSVPFSSHDGDTVVVRGTIDSQLEDPIDIDVRTPDPTQEGGVKGHGKILLDEPGAFELRVPKNLGFLELQAFQDAGGDGPTPDDPFAQASVKVASSDVDGVEMVLEVGTHGVGGQNHQEASPGAPGGDPGGTPASEAGTPGGDGGPGGARAGTTDPFAGVAGPRVTLRGTLDHSGPENVDLDLFAPDSESAGGRRMLGKLIRKPGAFEVQVPAGFGPLILEAFIDINSDGPGPGDPMGRHEGNPVMVGESDLEGIDIKLAVPADGRMPMGEPPPPQPDAPDLR